MDITSFEKFLVEHIKVDNKINQLNLGNVTVVREKSRVTVNSEVPMSKRYLKYLTKKCVPGALRTGAGGCGGGGGGGDAPAEPSRGDGGCSDCAGRLRRAGARAAGLFSFGIASAERVLTLFSPGT